MLEHSSAYSVHDLREPTAASSRHNFVTGVRYMLLSECPVRATIDVIEGKWKPIVVHALKRDTLRFGQLRRHVPEATQKVLTEQLRELERDCIIVRRTSQKPWERVEYSLTAYGRTLVPVLTLMARWARAIRNSNRLDPCEQRREARSNPWR